MALNPLFDRLYDWIRSELQWDRTADWSSKSGFTEKDPDLAAAEEELEEFLRGGASGRSSGQDWSSGDSRSYGQDSWSGRTTTADPKAAELAKAFLELGLSPGATWDDVKEAHRALLRQHHPDRHGGDKAALDAATKKSQRINEAYQIIKKALGK